LRELLAALAVVPLMLACVRVTSLATAPAAALHVELLFHGALVPGRDVTVGVRVRDEHGSFVAFMGSQRLSIDGVEIPEGAAALPDLTLTIARKAPGAGPYQLVYTDERGRRTAVAIPSPRADFAILQPAAGSRVLIPTPGGAGAAGRPGATPAPYSPRAPARADAPLTIRYAPPYLPGDVGGRQVRGHTAGYVKYVKRPYARGACASQWPRCAGVLYGVFPFGPAALTGTATIDDGTSPWGSGFETFAPGPGVVGASVTGGWHVPSTGFSDCYVQFDGDASVPITWV
jgi:hypothetical protein